MHLTNSEAKPPNALKEPTQAQQGAQRKTAKEEEEARKKKTDYRKDAGKVTSRGIRRKKKMSFMENLSKNFPPDK